MMREVRLGLVLLFFLAIARVAWLSDDAFISFRTMQNFVDGFGLTWNPGERVQAYTHPLWLLLMSAAYAVTREIFLTAIGVSLVVSTAAVGVVLFRSRLGLPGAIGFVALLLLSQALRDYTSSGLENPLSYLLLALFTTTWFADEPGSRPLFRLFLLGGLLVLNRMDCVWLVMPALALAFWQQRSRAALLAALLGLVPLFAWELFALVYYGFALPNTYYAKLSTGIQAQDYWTQGLAYVLDTLEHDPATLLILALGVVWSGAASFRHVAWPLALGMVLYLGYVVGIGGDFMQGRFFAVPVFLGAVLLTHGAAAQAWRPLAPALLVGVLAVAHAAAPPETGPPIRANGIADERAYYAGYTGLGRYRRELDMPANHPWAATGLAMRGDPVETVFTGNTIGIVGYIAGPRVHIVDLYALADPLLSRLPVEGGWRIGHFERRLPMGYLDSLRSGEDHIANPAIAALHARLQRVTRGPLFTRARWREIWALNTGAADLSREVLGFRPSVPAAQLADPKVDSSAWDGRGVLHPDAAGVDVVFDLPQHAGALSVSVDNNDEYFFEFYLAGDPVGRIDVAPAPSHGGLRVHRIQVPEAAIRQGWDRVRVFPRNGDGRYALGHLVPVGGSANGDIEAP